MLILKDIFVPFPSINVGGNDDESSKLEKYEVLNISIYCVRG